jgi:hypothetical protein
MWATYHFIEEIQSDLDKFMTWYNNDRTNQGRCCQGRTLMDTFIAGIDLYRQLVYDQELIEEGA